MKRTCGTCNFYSRSRIPPKKEKARLGHTAQVHCLIDDAWKNQWDSCKCWRERIRMSAQQRAEMAQQFLAGGMTAPKAPKAPKAPPAKRSKK